MVPPALRARLGEPGAEALENLLDAAGHVWRDEVITLAQERFDRRLAEELALFRQDMVRAMSDMRIDLHREIQTTRVDLMKWSFLFWVGQVAAVGGLMAAFRP
jgi:hypothetical protein